MTETQATTYCYLESFRWESLWRWDLGHNLLLSQAFRWESLWRWDLGFHGALGYHEAFSQTLSVFTITKRSTRNFSFFHDELFLFFVMEFWLSRSLSHELFFFHNGILAIKRPFTRTFLFSRWNSGYQEAIHTNFYFFTMEFWLSGSLSHELFFFHDGILAIGKPFTQTYLFSRWNSGY
jgi:hypothetical protein